MTDSPSSIATATATATSSGSNKKNDDDDKDKDMTQTSIPNGTRAAVENEKSGTNVTETNTATTATTTLHSDENHNDTSPCDTSHVTRLDMPDYQQQQQQSHLTMTMMQQQQQQQQVPPVYHPQDWNPPFAEPWNPYHGYPYQHAPTMMMPFGFVPPMTSTTHATTNTNSNSNSNDYLVPPNVFPGAMYNHYPYGYHPTQQAQIPMFMAQGFVAVPPSMMMMMTTMMDPGIGMPLMGPESHGYAPDDPQAVVPNDAPSQEDEEEEDVQGPPPPMTVPLDHEYLPPPPPPLLDTYPSHDNHSHHNNTIHQEQVYYYDYDYYQVPLSAWKLPSGNDPTLLQSPWLAKAWQILCDIRDRTAFHDDHDEQEAPSILTLKEFGFLEELLERCKFLIHSNTSRIEILQPWEQDNNSTITITTTPKPDAHNGHAPGSANNGNSIATTMDKHDPSTTALRHARELVLARELASHFPLADHVLDAVRYVYYTPDSNSNSNSTINSNRSSPTDIIISNKSHPLLQQQQQQQRQILAYTHPTIRFLLRYYFDPDGYSNGRILHMDLAHIQHELRIRSFHDIQLLAKWEIRNLLEALKRLDFLHHDQVQAGLAYYARNQVIDQVLASSHRMHGTRNDSLRTLHGYLAIYLGLVPINYTHFDPCNHHDTRMVWTVHGDDDDENGAVVMKKGHDQPRKNNSSRNRKKKQRQQQKDKKKEKQQDLQQQQHRIESMRTDTPTESCTTLSSVNSTPSSFVRGPGASATEPTSTGISSAHDDMRENHPPVAAMDSSSSSAKPANAWSKKKQQPRNANATANQPLVVRIHDNDLVGGTNSSNNNGNKKKVHAAPIQELTHDNFPPLPARVTTATTKAATTATTTKATGGPRIKSKRKTASS